MPDTTCQSDDLERGQVGVFWVFNGQVLACPVSLAQAERRGNRLDSPLAHVTEWPRLVARHRREMPILAALEYDEVPRGRVLFDLVKRRFVVYMDSSLFTESAAGLQADPEVAATLCATFQLGEKKVRFATDPHYRLNALDEDEDAER